MRHLVVSEREIQRRAEMMPTADGGREEAMRERMAVMQRPEFTLMRRHKCPGKCGRYVASGLCVECDSMSRARLLSAP